MIIQVSKEISNISAEEEVLLARVEFKARPITSAIEWQKGDGQAKEVLGDKNSELEASKESGREEDKDAEIKALKNRVSELEMLLELKKRKELVEPEFVLCENPEDDDPDAYVDLVCSGFKGDLCFETPQKVDTEDDKGEEKKMRSIILRLKAKSRKEKKDGDYLYYHLKRKADKLGKKGKKKKNKKADEQNLVEGEKGGKDDVVEDKIMEEKEADNKREEELVEVENQPKKVEKVVGDCPTFDLNLDLTRESAQELDSHQMGEKQVKQPMPPLAADEAIDVDELEIHDKEVGKFLPLSKMKDRLMLLGSAERAVVQRFFKNANKRYVLIFTPLYNMVLKQI